ncbi:MAG: hypothetical protein COW84_08975 [Gammaproteobacteria bacterium CG22_combo_CG10-13_8_21_14_all_40_8]|nr:MAG: hypothetical protein COW84_08975 [Gammaproteobacteria bacterium CG22_combo_CG10-13_8_21_14_all_40_8]
MTQNSSRTSSHADSEKDWNKEQYVAAMKYCQKNQLIVDKFDAANSRVLPPVLAIWKVQLKSKPLKAVWIIGGSVLMDHVDASVAPDARAALKHFSLNWQLRASQLEQDLANNVNVNLSKEKQQEVIDTLVRKAETLYQLADDSNIWN